MQYPGRKGNLSWTSVVSKTSLESGDKIEVTFFFIRSCLEKANFKRLLVDLVVEGCVVGIDCGGGHAPLGPVHRL